DLRRLQAQAGGPSVRALGEAVGLGKSQVSAILGGRIRRPPDWRVVRGLVEALYRYAREHDREHRLSIRSGVEEYWRPRYAVVEPAADRPPGRPDEAVPRQLPPVAPHFVGRGAELDAVTRAAGPVLVTGMAGVGKTTLAVAWAHRSARLFPDGQLYVNLRGFDPSGTAVTPEQAV